MFGLLFSPARHLAAYVALLLYKPYALFFLMIANIIFMTFMCCKNTFFLFYTHMGHVVFVALLFQSLLTLVVLRIYIRFKVLCRAKFNFVNAIMLFVMS